VFLNAIKNAGAELDKQLATWLEVVPDIQQDDDGGNSNSTSTDKAGPVKAIIAPHAGYSYSGSVMAYAYKHLNPDAMYVDRFV